MRWNLTTLMASAKNVAANRSNEPSVRDLESMLAAFEYWKGHYDASAKKYRERAAKLELIGDSEASMVRRHRDGAEEDVAKCDVGIRTMKWAIATIKATQP